MRQEELLINRQPRMPGSDMYPFHMPGHKRRTGPEDFFMNSLRGLLYKSLCSGYNGDWGFDNLHHRGGILKDSHEMGGRCLRCGPDLLSD